MVCRPLSQMQAVEHPSVTQSKLLLRINCAIAIGSAVGAVEVSASLLYALPD